MRGREQRDPVAVRRFAAVWPHPPTSAVDGLPPPVLPGLTVGAWRDPPGLVVGDPPPAVGDLAAGVWPEAAGRREAEELWQALDHRAPGPGLSPQPAGGPPDAPADAPHGEPPPLPPPAGRSALGSFDPGRRGVRVLGVVAVLVVLVAAYLAWRSRPQTEPVPTVAATGAPSVSGPPASTGAIVVAVQGKVLHPGLYKLPAGSRVADALNAAGGALPGVDLSFVNVARKLVDGELIVVGATPPPEQAGASAPGGKVDLNTATLAQLETLPGIGPALAQRIVDFRTQHGGFRSINELRQVGGIGDAKFAQLKDLVTVL